MTKLPELRISKVFKIDFVLDGVVAPVYVLGNTEEEAIEKANNFWSKEQERVSKMFRDDGLDELNVVAKSVSHSNIGKVWLINKMTKERKRAEAHEVDELVAHGWVRGGPRTKV